METKNTRRVKRKPQQLEDPRVLQRQRKEQIDKLRILVMCDTIVPIEFTWNGKTFYAKYISSITKINNIYHDRNLNNVYMQCVADTINQIRSYTGYAVLFDEKANLIYTGGMKRGKRHGPGQSYYEQGIKKYDGNWKNDKKNGAGRMFHKNGNIMYIGEWKNNMAEGRGNYYCEDGPLLYVGYWKDDYQHGTGTIFHKNKQIRFTGNFVKGKLDGKCTEFDQQGQMVYQGMFKDNKIHGPGICYKNGMKFRRMYDMNVLLFSILLESSNNDISFIK